MSTSRWLMGAIVVALCWTTQATVAQTGGTSRSIGQLMTQLTDGSNPRGVADARSQIISGLRNGSAQDVQGRVDQLAAALPAALEASQPEIVRINAVLVAAAMDDPRSVALLTQGLRDEHEAVRLPAARGMMTVARRLRDADASVQANWRDALGQMLEGLSQIQQVESSGRVIDYSFRTMSLVLEVDRARATPAVLQALSHRANGRLADRHGRMQGEYNALQRIYRNMVTLGSNASQEQMRGMAAASFRYLDVCATVLDENARAATEDRLTDQAVRDYQQMFNLADTVIGWSTQQLAPGTPRYESLPQPINARDARLRVEAWRAVLRGQPISLPNEMLSATAD